MQLKTFGTPGGEAILRLVVAFGEDRAPVSDTLAGRVPDAADLVVSDPVQAGVMAVMAIADTAKFNIVRQQKRRY
jgi:energy-converting hydrogenase B subunit Q